MELIFSILKKISQPNFFYPTIQNTKKHISKIKKLIELNKTTIKNRKERERIKLTSSSNSLSRICKIYQISCDQVKYLMHKQFKIFNKTLKSHNRNIFMISSKSVGCNFIHNNCNLFFQKKKKKKKTTKTTIPKGK